MIRSERQAFDRLFPGEMPQEIEVIDTEYLDPKAAEAQSAAKAPNEQGALFITQAQVNKLWTEARNRKYSSEDVHTAIGQRYEVVSVKELTRDQASELIDDLVQGKDILAPASEESGQAELPL